MSRKTPKFDAYNEDYQYYSARLIDLNEMLSDTNRELNGMDDDLHTFKRRSCLRRGKKQPKDYFKDYDARSSLSDDDDLYECRSRIKQYNKRSKSMKCSLDESLHDLHRKVRDISFEQEKMADQLNSEDLRCKCDTLCSKKNCRTKKLSSDSSETSFENRLENRIEKVYNKIKKKYEQKSVNDELKSVIEDFKKTTANLVKEDLHKTPRTNFSETDYEKQKAQNELVVTRQKIADLEESKNSLSQQVLRLKEQLEKFESAQQSPIDSKAIPLQIHQTISRELESFREKLEKSSQKSTEPNETITVINMYKSEIEKLNETIQGLRKSLKDKDLQEFEYKHDNKTLTEKNSELEKSNSSLRNDLDLAIQKMNELVYEQSQNISQLRLYEDELGISEKKRDELRQEAQETIKLWKNKVKKLEKNLERTRVEVETLSQQNEYLREASKNLTIQLENIGQEYNILRDLNKTLEHKLSTQGTEINKTKSTYEDLKNENYSLKTEISGSQNSVRTIELKNQELMIENSRLDQKLKTEEAKSTELEQKLCQIQSELDQLKSEKRRTSAYVSKLEFDCQNLKNSVANLERSEEMTKNDLTTISKQCLQNKETYEETLSKCTSQLQLAHAHFQKNKLEYEDKIRSLQIQLAEEKSNMEILKKREAEYTSEIDEQKSQKQKFENDLVALQCRMEKFVRSDAEKSQLLAEYEEKYSRLLDEFNYQKNQFYNRETEYIKILNHIEVDLDLLVGILAVNLNKNYQSTLNTDETDKINSSYMLIKHKIHWISKNLEELFQQKVKLQQNLVFLEHEIETMKKNSAHNIKAQGVYLKNLENQNHELMADRDIALKNMELLEQYLQNLSESVKNHSLREIERTHHLFAIDNIQNLCNNNNLSEAEKEEIFERFKRYKSTIDDIKYQLDSAQIYCENFEPKDKTVRNSSSCSSSRSQRSSSYSHYACKKQAQAKKQPAKPKPFR
ncbi:hypothetical protein BpHYR1_023328 [Brachionus plicatilis]|uniref:Uncharacterized protein n=1 Tax=Brachionus plicatilis TaxID=10195 RepID=A0A3M7SS99_BRAPC|nr:hypothetical protein BpHYR1_023328 [Brachionus plicatilis]